MIKSALWEHEAVALIFFSLCSGYRWLACIDKQYLVPCGPINT